MRTAVAPLTAGYYVARLSAMSEAEQYEALVRVPDRFRAEVADRLGLTGDDEE